MEDSIARDTVGAMDERQYNESYVDAKVRQAKKHAVTGQEDASHKDRLPPGQILTQQFPVLDLGIRPTRDRYARWTIEFKGCIERPQTLSLDDIKKIPKDERTLDFHCVTRWSRYDLHWGGVTFSKMAEQAGVQPSAKVVVFHSFDGYTTNVLLEEIMNDNVLIAYELDGKEIPPEHGGPVRVVIPTLYGWKSAKFLTGIEFLDHDEPGFWEVRGYNNHADPWLEERYS